METDPVTNSIYNGIKRGIVVCIENECLGSAVLLIYSGIDAMAFLGMPRNQVNVNRNDFISWCDKYIVFPGTEQVTGRELYSARCGMLHTFGVESNLTREAGVRKLGYMDQCDPPILFQPELENGLVLVSIESLANAFYEAIDRFLVDLFMNENDKQFLESRLNKLCVAFPVKNWDLAEADTNQNIEQNTS